jgi:hypothetical protein
VIIAEFLQYSLGLFEFLELQCYDYAAILRKVGSNFLRPVYVMTAK